MYLLRFTVIATLFLSAALSQAVLPELPPIGYAKFHELGKELFIVSLRADSHALSKNNTISLSGRQRLDLKISSDRIFPRKFINLFIQGAAVNNRAEFLKANAEHMATFATAIRGKLVKGDHLVFFFDGEKQTQILLNTIELTRIESSQFFTVILNTWVGPVPPSTTFRRSILGREDYSPAKTEFALLLADESRTNKVNAWLHTESGNKNEDATEAPQEAITNIAATKAAAAVPIDKVKITRQTTVTKAIDQIQADAQDSLIEETLEQATTSKFSRIQRTKKQGKLVADQGKSTLTEVALAKAPKHKTEASVESVSLEYSLETINAEQIIQAQLYTQQLLKISQQSIKYPRRAQTLRQTGSVLASVTIGRDGQLNKLTLVDETKYSSLNKAVIKGIRKAEPFPPIPEAVAGKEFSFVVPVTFDLR